MLKIETISNNKLDFIRNFNSYIWMQMPLGNNEVKYMQLTKQFAIDCLENIDESLYQVVTQHGALYIEKPAD